MRFENLTQEQKEIEMRRADTLTAIGGGTVTPQMRQDMSDILDGKKTTEQVRREIMVRHGVIKP